MILINPEQGACDLTQGYCPAASFNNLVISLEGTSASIQPLGEPHIIWCYKSGLLAHNRWHAPSTVSMQLQVCSFWVQEAVGLSYPLQHRQVATQGSVSTSP